MFEWHLIETSATQNVTLYNNPPLTIILKTLYGINATFQINSYIYHLIFFTTLPPTKKQMLEIYTTTPTHSLLDTFSRVKV